MLLGGSNESNGAMSELTSVSSFDSRDDLRGEGVSPVGKARYPEKLMKRNRRIEFIGIAAVDDINTISHGLASETLDKGYQLHFHV
jgi:hypothetical protein